jgi:hypothetical protein
MATKKHTTSSYTPTLAPLCNWNDITEPGTYVFLEWGTLIRVPECGITSQSPTVTFFSNMPTQVALLSNDPYIPISKARQLAADMDLAVNF